MRAIAKHLELSAWPTCMITYATTCEDEDLGMRRQEVLMMLDTLVGAVAAVHTGSRVHKNSGQIALRVAFNWRDRLYHHALPWFFNRPVLRTVQATHYHDHQLRSPTHRLCSRGQRRGQPFSCDADWTNFARTCSPVGNDDYDMCEDVTDDLWRHVTRRYQTLVARYPNQSIELLIVEALEEWPLAGVIHHGRQLGDIVTLFRIRNCPSPSPSSPSSLSCETIAIDDYRYEVETLQAEVTSWYGLVATVRLLGQLYAWARLALLFGGCYVAVGAPSSPPSSPTLPLSKSSPSSGSRLELWLTRIRAASHTFFLIPSQTIIYGSVVPIACYAVAHVLDAAVVYDLVAWKFATVLGMLDIDVLEILRVGAVAMRTVWLLALVSHLISALCSRRGMYAPWRNGVVGVREYALSLVASLTIASQIRTLGWRDTSVVEVFELSPHAVGRRAAQRSHHRQQGDATWGSASRLLRGTTLDVRCLLSAGLLVLVGVSTLYAIDWGLSCVYGRRWLHGQWRHRDRQRHRRTGVGGSGPSICGRTMVPYAAGFLWPTQALVVSWPRSLPSAAGGTRRVASASTSASASLARVAPPRVSLIHPMLAVPKTMTKTPQVVTAMTTSAAAGDAFAQLEAYVAGDVARQPPWAPSVESLVGLLHLTAMTDPLTFVRLRCGAATAVPSGGGQGALGVYRVRRTGHCLLLPMALASASGDVPIDWAELECLAVVPTNELSWGDLLCCG